MLIGSTNKIVIKTTRMKHKSEYCSHCATQAKRPRRVVFADKKVCITNTTGLGQPWRSNSRSNSCRERHFVRLNSGRMILGRENGKSHTEILQTVMSSSKMMVNYALKFVQLISRMLILGRILNYPSRLPLSKKRNKCLTSKWHQNNFIELKLHFCTLQCSSFSRPGNSPSRFPTFYCYSFHRPWNINITYWKHD